MNLKTIVRFSILFRIYRDKRFILNNKRFYILLNIVTYKNFEGTTENFYITCVTRLMYSQKITTITKLGEDVEVVAMKHLWKTRQTYNNISRYDDVSQ